MEDCKIGKQLNPKTCRYVVKCKEGFIRNDQFRCRKENSKPRVAKPKNKNKTNKMGEEVFNPNFTKKSKGKTKTAKTKPNTPNVNEESYNENEVLHELEDSPPVNFTPKKRITKKVNIKTPTATANESAISASKANISKATANFIKGLSKKGYKISTPKANTPTAKVNATPKAKPNAKVNATPKAKEYNGIIRVKRTGQFYKGIRHTEPDGLGPFLIAGDLSILDHYRREPHVQPSVNGSDYDKDANIYFESLNPVTKNLFEKAVKQTPKYDVLKHSNKAGWLALLSHLNLYRYNPYKLGLLGLFPLTKMIDDDPLPSMGIKGQMPIISTCITPLPGEKGYGVKPDLPYELPSAKVKENAKVNANDNSEIKLNVKRMKKDAIADILGTTQNMYDSTVFMFYSKSKSSKPGMGKGEYINEEETEKYKQLDEIHNWRQKLSNFHIEPFELNGKQWQSVEHYYQGSKFRKQNPDFYNEFSLDSDSEISKDPAMAKSAGGKEGKYKGKLIRSRNIKIDDDFFVNGRDTMEMIKAQYSKFTQNPDLTYLLYLTKNAKLVHYVRGQDPVTFYNLMYIRSLITDN